MKTKSPELEKVVRKFAGLTIGIIGDLMLDELLRGEATRISPEAPVPVLLVRDELAREAFPGGAGNVASNVTALGAGAVVFGALGSDATGVQLKALLRARGIDARHVVSEPGRVTPRKVRLAAHQQQLMRVDFEHPQPIARRTEVLLARRFARSVAGLSAVIISDYLKGSVTTALCARSVALARRRGLPVLVDPKPEHSEICTHTSLATPNLHEAEAMAGVPLDDVEARLARAPALRDSLGCEAMLITRGGAGMTLVDADGSVREVASQSRPVYDVTGAGDTVIAVMALAMAAGASLGDAAELANIAGGRVVLKFGTATLAREELLEAIRS